MNFPKNAPLGDELKDSTNTYVNTVRGWIAFDHREDKEELEETRKEIKEILKQGDRNRGAVKRASYSKPGF